jgi:hypothetical protein
VRPKRDEHDGDDGVERSWTRDELDANYRAHDDAGDGAEKELPIVGATTGGQTAAF